MGFANQSSRGSESSAAAVLIKAEAAIVRMARAQARGSRIVGVWRMSLVAVVCAGEGKKRGVGA